MKPFRLLFAAGFLFSATASGLVAQEYGSPDRGEPGDEMIQSFLAEDAERIHATFLEGVTTLEDWEARRGQYEEEYLHMLGLWPLPERTPLQATVTGTLEGEGYVVEMVHYQSRPGLYVTGNLYRPKEIKAGERLPAVLYVCGHSYQGQAGNKTAYQSHGIWFARHGYVCLVLDTLQLGEIEALHHGTYRENRWWWHSRGYTPAGVECWNGMRGIDYLISRSDVDSERLAVTGISGGGAATFWIAAADPRVTVAVPVSGMADLPSYVGNRVINGHCDCMFLYNTFQWSWARIAGLIAPRPLLFVNSDEDPIFPMDANDRVINRLERVYSLYGAGDLVDAVVSIGGHAYRKDIRQAAYRFINTHLKEDPRAVHDSELDLATGERSNRVYPIPIEKLRVFPSENDFPEDELNTTIDEHFVPMAEVPVPEQGDFQGWRTDLLNELRRVSFRSFPERIPPGEPRGLTGSGATELETEPGIRIRVHEITGGAPASDRGRLLLGIGGRGAEKQFTEIIGENSERGDALFLCEPRGMGESGWTQKNPPNYVERSHVLLGRTADTGRVRDIIAAARALRQQHPDKRPLLVVGEGKEAVLAAYAALWEPEIDGVILRNPVWSHMNSDAPQFLNVLRVCDVPEVIGMLAPRPVWIIAPNSPEIEKIAAIYSAADAGEGFVHRSE